MCIQYFSLCHRQSVIAQDLEITEEPAFLALLLRNRSNHQGPFLCGLVCLKRVPSSSFTFSHIEFSHALIAAFKFVFVHSLLE